MIDFILQDMRELEFNDIESVFRDEELNRLGASFYLFGSLLSKNIKKESINDVDIAIMVSPESKLCTMHRLFKIARTANRRLNWNIDVYDPNLTTYGYNGKTNAPLHFFIIDQDELNSDSVISKSIKQNYTRLTLNKLYTFRNG